MKNSLGLPHNMGSSLDYTLVWTGSAALWHPAQRQMDYSAISSSQRLSRTMRFSACTNAQLTVLTLGNLLSVREMDICSYPQQNMDNEGNYNR